MSTHQTGRPRRRLPALPPALPAQTLAEAFDALGVVMDAYAKQGYDRPFGDVTRDRRVLWSAANVLRRLCYYATGSVPDYLRSFEAEPKRRSERCGRPTLKGTRCKNPVKFGRVACHSHATPEETLAAREWQDSVHLPFARSPLHLGGQVRVASLGLIDVLKELA